MLSIALYRFDSKINLWGIKWLEAYPTCHSSVVLIYAPKWRDSCAARESRVGRDCSILLRFKRGGTAGKQNSNASSRCT